MNLEEIFRLILITSAMGSIVALLILFIKSVLGKHINAHWSYLIWFVLLVRLIFPFAPESPTSIYNIVTSDYFAGVEQISKQEDTYEPDGQYEKQTRPDSDQEIEAPSYTDTPAPVENDANETVHQSTYWFYAASLLWLVGVFLLALYTLAANFKWWVKLKNKSTWQDENINKLLLECKEKMNLSTPVTVYSDPSINSPTMFTFFKPRLVLPPDLLETLEEKEVKYVFFHELAHLKRRDTFVGWLMMLLQTIHWFNPLIWYAFSKMRQDCEIACDATVLSYLKTDEYNHYAMTIISVLEMASNRYFMPGTSFIKKNNSDLKRRLIMIKKFKKHAVIWSAVAVFIFIVLVLVGLTNPISIARQGELVNRGNTVGNISNQGLVAEYENNIYYSNLSDGGRIYKKEMGYDNSQPLTEEKAEYINVLDGWIYYSVPGVSEGQEYGLYKIKTDGSERTRVAEEDIMHLNVVEDWIYYVAITVEEETYKADIYKVNTDGSNKTLIKEANNVSHMNVVDGWIYYTEAEKDPGVYKVKVDGSESYQLYEGMINSLNVVNNHIYYATNDGVFKMDTAGENHVMLSEDSSNNLNVTESWVYYVNQGEEWSNIYRMKPDGSENTRLNAEMSFNINIARDRVYYESAERELEYVSKDEFSDTPLEREREEVDRETVEEQIRKITLDLFGEAPVSESQLPWIQNTSEGGLRQVLYRKELGHATIRYRCLPETQQTNEINQAKEEVMELLAAVSALEDIDYYVDILAIDILFPTESDEFHHETEGETVEIWRQKMAIAVSGETLVNTDWNNITSVELGSKVDINIFE